MMMTGPLLAWIQKLAVKHFALEVQNLFTKATTFTPVFRLLLVMTETNFRFHIVAGLVPRSRTLSGYYRPASRKPRTRCPWTTRAGP